MYICDSRDQSKVLFFELIKELRSLHPERIVFFMSLVKGSFISVKFSQ